MFKLFSVAILASLFTAQLNAAWYWPFDPDSTNKPPRLHRLMANANDLIEKAEDEALYGNADKSIEYYREALKELDRIALENPDRAETPEFAPLRSKRATCAGAIDAIRFAQVKDNERAVSVSNTTELERKWRKKHNRQTPEDIAAEKAAAAATNQVACASSVTNQSQTLLSDLAVRSPTNKVSTATSNSTNKTAEAKAELQNFKTELPKEKMRLPKSDGSVAQDIKLALAHIRNGNYVKADSLMDKALAKEPKNLNAMLVRAAAQTGSGNKYAARRTLERAMRIHPKSYLPYYNLANISLQLDDKAVAREYYEMGRSAGGPVNDALEKLLK